MNLRDLEYFLAVAEEGHFGKAAFRCFVSQPTLSGQISKLEEELGAPLFERSTRTIKLTPFGEEAVGWARKAVQASQTLLELGKAQQDPLQGPLQIGAFPTMGPWWLPPLAPLLGKALPKIEFYFHELKTPELLQRLQKGELDAAFLADPDGAEFDGEALAFEPFYLLVSARHAWAKKKIIHTDELLEQEILLLEDGHCLRGQVLDLCQRLGAKEKGLYRATGLETLRQTVRIGDSMTLIPAMSVGEPEKSLRAIPFTAPVPGRTISLRWRSTHPRSQALRKVAATVRHFAEEQGVLSAVREN